MPMKSIFIKLAVAAVAIICGCTPEADKDLTGGNGKDGGNSETITPDWTDPAWYSTYYWDRTDREKAGLRGPVKKWHIGTYSTYTEYEYDRNGYLVKESRVDTQKPGSNSEFSYSYDSAGHLLKKEYSDQFTGEDFGEYTEYEYGNTGKYVAMEWFMMGPEISDVHTGISKDVSRSLNVIKQPLTSQYSECTYTFNADGNLVIRSHSYSTEAGSDQKLNESVLEYLVIYENGLPKSLDSEDLRFKVLNVSYYPNGMFKDFKYMEENSYNYDTGWDTHTYKMLDNPRILAVESFELGGKPSSISLTPGRMTKTYDEHFDIVKNEEWYSDAAQPTYTDTWREYVYDKYGNWTSRVENVVARYTGQTSDAVITRVIEYFDD